MANSPSENTPSRYVVGFDLGTTNSAVTYVDTADDPWRVRVFAVPQLVAAGQVEARETLPSFHYQPGPGELPPAALRLPWTAAGAAATSGRDEPPHVVGFFARDHGAVVPGRLISSAKSWLCHSGVDRTAAILPWHGAADVQRLSPVEVSAGIWPTSARPGTPAFRSIRWPSRISCSRCRPRSMKWQGN